jgi:tetraacyldisaccharide 4'-kinase
MASMGRVEYIVLPQMLTVARGFEEGRYQGVFARYVSLAWAEVSARTVVRSLRVLRGTRIVAVGGATLGGSGKTPLAIACARELARGGTRVALVGHAYRARPGRARIVSTFDPLAEVGDEALVAAQALEAQGVRVVVAPSRSGAVELAARHADVLVLDGVLQLTPARAFLSLLAVDAEEPWGRAEAVPPRGDLRAPMAALLAATDMVVRIGERPADARILSLGAERGGTIIPWATLRSLRIGVACALARPHRLLRFLARRGVTPVALARAGDHTDVPARALLGKVDLWLATRKCSFHVPSHVPIATIHHELELDPSVSARLTSCMGGGREPSGRASHGIAHLDPRRRRQ